VARMLLEAEPTTTGLRKLSRPAFAGFTRDLVREIEPCLIRTTW